MKRFSYLIFDVSYLPKNGKLFDSLYGSYSGSYPTGSLLKDGKLPTIALSSAYMGITLMAT